MTNHKIALAVARIIREAMYVNDGHSQPCVGGVLNPQWVQARSNNAATVIADLFHTEAMELIRLLEVKAAESRGNVVKGEIGAVPTEPVASRYGFDESPESLADRLIK